MFDLSFKKRSQDGDSNDIEAPVVPERAPKPFREAILPVFACGAGLFSDGYINNASPTLETHQSSRRCGREI
jgi:hypothetical protein